MKISFSANKKDPTVENNVKLPYAASKRVFPKIRWILILTLVFSPFIIFLGKVILDFIFVTSPGSIWLEKRIVNAIEAGTVEKVFYQIGDMTGPDAVMFQVKRKIPEGRLEQIAFLEAERDAINMEAKRGTTWPVVRGRNISAEVQLATQNILYYEKARNDTKWLLDQGAATKAEMDLAENRLREAKAALAALTNAVSEINPVRAAQVEHSINSLKNMTEEFFEIKSSREGKVNSILVSEGQSFSAGEPLAIVLDTKQVHIVTYVDPSDFKKINIGTVATVKIFGTGRKIKAVVEQPPITVNEVPSGISGKIYPANTQGVQVFLKVLDPLQENEVIEGFPVEVCW